MNGDMNGAVTFLPIGDDGSGRPFGIGDAAPPPVDRPIVDVAGDVMTCDPDRVAGIDTLLEVASRMRSLLVAFLPVPDPDGALRGIIALAGPAPRRPRRGLHRGDHVLAHPGAGGDDRGG